MKRFTAKAPRFSGKEKKKICDAKGEGKFRVKGDVQGRRRLTGIGSGNILVLYANGKKVGMVGAGLGGGTFL